MSYCGSVTIPQICLLTVYIHIISLGYNVMQTVYTTNYAGSRIEICNSNVKGGPNWNLS